jgi:Family of unknown function (DUF6328)
MNELAADQRPSAGGTGRHETEAERIDRNLSELLQELRVASIGVQVLFGFLLSLPFTTGFRRLQDDQRTLYLVDLLLAASASALLTAPVAYHRLVFRRHAKEGLLRTANAFAIAGIGVVGLTISGSVLLVLGTVYDGVGVAVVASLTTLAIFGLWFGLPLHHRRRDDY